MASVHFADRLLAAVEEKKSPLVVGIDPVFESLPPSIREHRMMNDADDSEAAADALYAFGLKIMKIVAPHVPAVKINGAFFERYHWDGVEAYMNLVQEAQALGLLVIGDVKRGDIGNTSLQYAQGNLADAPGIDMNGPDSITISPYMGIDSIQPFLDVAAKENKGLFVLVRTSNKSSADIQEFRNAEGQPLYMHVAALVEKWGAQTIGARGYSAMGAVVGATNGQQLAELRAAMPHAIFLVPGLGAQGGTAQDAAMAFKADKTGAVINASRSIIFAYKDAKYAGLDWEKAVEQSVIETKKQIADALGL